MKLIALLITLIIPSIAFAQSQIKAGADSLIIGSSSSNAKAVVFETGDAANNKKLSVDKTTKKATLNTDLDIVGNTAITGTLNTSGAATIGGSISASGAISGLTGLTSSGTVTLSGIEVNSSNTAISTNGNNISITSSSTSVYRLTGATLNSISCFANTTAGRKILLINATGKRIKINEDSCGTATQGFYTGKSSGQEIEDKGSVEAIYNTTLARWVLIGTLVSDVDALASRGLIISSRSDATSSVRVEFCAVSNGGSASMGEGCSHWLTSVSRTSAGNVGGVIKSNIFSSAPVCLFNIQATTSNPRNISGSATATSFVSYAYQASTATDYSFAVLCIGEK